MTTEKLTLQELVEEGRRRIAAERARADAWAAAQPQREAQAADAFRQYMAENENVILGDDVLVVVAEEACNPGWPRDSVYAISMIFPALEARIDTRYGNGMRLAPDDETRHNGVYWKAITTGTGNYRYFYDLTDALLWLTDGQSLPADLSDTGLAVTLPEYAYAA